MRSLLLLALALPVAASAQQPAPGFVTLTNGRGMVVRLLPQGAAVAAIEVPDRQGRTANVVLGYPTPADYRARTRRAFFGATIGRYAGRIGGARFVLDGKPVSLVPNEGPNALHGGGTRGFESENWQVTRTGSDRASFSLVSPEGYQGFPGRLTVTVRYRLTADNALRIDYAARTNRPTVLNLTNHAYFNLAGEGSGTVDDQLLQIRGARSVATDARNIPTGETPPVAGTPLDFRCPRAIGGAMTYNHGWMLDKRAGRLGPAARLIDPASGRTLTVETTEPSIQVYTAGHLDGTDVGPGGRAYQARAGVALEVQHPSDAPNRPHFSSTVLRPGQVYRQTTIWRFGTDGTARPGCG